MHSRPSQGIGNQGDEMRLILAAMEFANPCCATDPRVRTSFEGWAQMRQLAPLVTYLRRVPQDVDAIVALSTALSSAQDPANQAWADRLVDDVLRIPYRVGPLLSSNSVSGSSPPGPANREAAAAGGPQPPEGRSTWAGRASDNRRRRWYYRDEVLADPDALHVLVEEYVRASGRGPAHSVVQNRIDQLKVLLSLVQIVGASSTPT